MSAPKRTKIQRERDLETTARLYLQMHTQAEIAEVIGVTRTQIAYDLKIVQKRWMEASVASLDERKSIELAKIDDLERTYRDAWLRSLKEFRSVTKTIDDSPESVKLDKDGKRIPSKPTHRTRGSIKTEVRNGDPKYLEGVRWCIQKRVDILGLDAPKKIAGDEENPIPIKLSGFKEMTPDELRVAVKLLGVLPPE